MSNNIKKPVYKKWWFWTIIIAVALFVIFLIVPSGSDSDSTTSSSDELTLDQNLAIGEWIYAIAQTSESKVKGSTSHGEVSKKNCELIREAVKNYDGNATYFSDSFCDTISRKAKQASTDSGDILWLTDGKNVAKIQTKKVDDKTYIDNYEFTELDSDDGYEVVEILPPANSSN